MIRICKFAAYSMLAACILVTPAFAQETEEAENNSETVEMTESEQTYVLPELSIDAERATYQALITRPQDEITSEQIESMPTHNPVEMIRSYNSSIRLGDGLGGATVAPSIRGLSSRYTNVTVDGMTINTPWNWSSPLSGFPLSRLSKITLSNTGSAMVNGQNSVAGSINFVLPSGKSHKGFTLGMETGGEGTRHIDVMYGFEDGDNQHLIGVFSDKYDGTRRFTDGSWYKNSRDNLMFYYKGQIALSHGWLFKTTIMHNEGSITCGDAWRGNFERFDPWKLSLRSYALFKDFGNESNFTLRYARYNDYSRDVYYTDGTFTQVMNPGHEDGFTNVNMKTWEALYNFKANDKNYINIGVVNQKVSDSHDSLSKDFQNIEHDNTSFFIADSLRATDKLNIHLVARSDEDYEGERATSYSINTNYDVNDKFSIGAGYSHTIQLPTLQDLYRANSRNGNWRGIVGNPNLENEKSNSYEFRIGYKANDRWNLNLTGYRYNIDDMVGVKTAGELGLAGQNGWFRDRYGNNIQFANNTEVATNIDEAVIQGYELGARGKLSDSFNLALSYTNFKKAEDKTTKVRLESVPDYRATMALEYCHEKTTAVLSLSHQGKTKARPGNGVTKLDSSTLCNFYIRQQCNKDFAVYLKIANIGNKRDAVLSQYVLGNHNANGANGYFYEDGRVITLGMELKCD
ncbi:MAG: TonB-dependent receptor [Candidatus Riflebacteria bacterium]|nr:TonB-dependent receptor [Candidatus Riflebacteria bacterium]